MVDEWYPSWDSFSTRVVNGNLLAIIIKEGMLVKVYTTPAKFICIVIKKMAMVASDGTFRDWIPLVNLRASKKMKHVGMNI
jgi:hypothetical protein